MKLVWIRNDLRLKDNPALYHACIAAQEEGDEVRVIYTITPAQWQHHHDALAKLGFRQQALTHLIQSLASKGISTDQIRVDWFKQVPQAIRDYCRQHRVTSIWFNDESGFNEKQRDRAVVDMLQAEGIECREFATELMVDTGLLLTQQVKPYKVFTAWYRLWVRRLQQITVNPLPEPPAVDNAVQAATIEFPNTANYRSDLWPALESLALQRLDEFLQQQEPFYAEHRDFPCLRGTSLLSPYLASGMISTREAIHRAISVCESNGKAWEESIWIKELGWREFYRYLMIEFPYLSKNKPFRSETETLVWEQNSLHQRAWELGETGFPIIDAAMRQLHQTGWMHNRLRMLVASFYTKLLLLDWRGGEQYFMQQLLDGDFPSNNGGWQWSASTGCDASPWFRIFNPIKQSEKFDPQGQFIRKFVPELAALSDRQIHFPDAAVREQLGYPMPIVDYRIARQRALDRFGQLSKAS